MICIVESTIESIQNKNRKMQTHITLYVTIKYNLVLDELLVQPLRRIISSTPVVQ